MNNLLKRILIILVCLMFASCKSPGNSSETSIIPLGDGKNLISETAAKCDEVPNSFKKLGTKTFLTCSTVWSQSYWEQFWDGTTKEFYWIFTVGQNKRWEQKKYPYEIQLCSTKGSTPENSKAHVSFFVGEGVINPDTGLDIHAVSAIEFKNHNAGNVTILHPKAYPIETTPLGPDGRYHGTITFAGRDFEIVCVPTK